MLIDLDPQKMPHPPFHMEKEGEASKGLRTIIKEGITITNLTKKISPILSTWEDGWGNNYNKWSSMVMSPPSICAWSSTSSFAFSCFDNGTTWITLSVFYNQNSSIQIHFNLINISLRCFPNIFNCFHLLLFNNLSWN